MSVRDAWRLTKPYWTSEEKWSAWGLLLAVVVLNLGNVYISVRINTWNNAFYNALQSFNSGEFFHQLGIFSILAAFYIVFAVYAVYLNQMLQIRWRRWLTRRYLGAWLGDRAFYQLQLGSTTDNPDQRIAEDLNQFTTLRSESFTWASYGGRLIWFRSCSYFGGSPGPQISPSARWGHCIFRLISFGRLCSTPASALG